MGVCECAQGQGMMGPLQSHVHPAHILAGLMVVMLQGMKKTCTTHINTNLDICRSQHQWMSTNVSPLYSVLLHSLKRSLNHQLPISWANFTLQSPLCNSPFNQCPSLRQTALIGNHSWKQQITLSATALGHKLDTKASYHSFRRNLPLMCLYHSHTVCCVQYACLCVWL